MMLAIIMVSIISIIDMGGCKLTMLPSACQTKKILFLCDSTFIMSYQLFVINCHCEEWKTKLGVATKSRNRGLVENFVGEDARQTYSMQKISQILNILFNFISHQLVSTTVCTI